MQKVSLRKKQQKGELNKDLDHITMRDCKTKSKNGGVDIKTYSNKRSSMS